MNVMKRAWEIAKAAVVEFGGKVREYFGQSLKQAWAEKKGTFVAVKKATVTMFDVMEKYGKKALQAVGSAFNPMVYISGHLKEIGKSEIMTDFFQELEETKGWKKRVSDIGFKVEYLSHKVGHAYIMLDEWINGIKPAQKYNQ